MFYNPYAAVPSLHVGLAFAIGVAAAGALRPRWAKILALTWGPVVTLSVVATGNHYVLDVVAGVALALVGHAAALALERRRLHRAARRLLESQERTSPKIVVQQIVGQQRAARVTDVPAPLPRVTRGS